MRGKMVRQTCTVCGGPVLWGARHSICGQRVMAAEELDLDELERIANTKEAAQRAAMWREADPANPLNSPGVVGAPGSTDAERAAWLADKIVALGDYAKEAAEMLRRWPSGVEGKTNG